MTAGSPKSDLARNVRYLMDRERLSESQLARRAGVGQKTINNVLNSTHSPKLVTVDAIANAFGLNGWHLIMPNLPDDLISSPTISRLYENFLRASGPGRELIEHVAAREANHGA